MKLRCCARRAGAQLIINRAIKSTRPLTCSGSVRKRRSRSGWLVSSSYATLISRGWAASYRVRHERDTDPVTMVTILARRTTAPYAAPTGWNSYPCPANQLFDWGWRYALWAAVLLKRGRVPRKPRPPCFPNDIEKATVKSDGVLRTTASPAEAGRHQGGPTTSKAIRRAHPRQYLRTPPEIIDEKCLGCQETAHTEAAGTSFNEKPRRFLRRYCAVSCSSGETLQKGLPPSSPTSRSIRRRSARSG